MITQIEIDGFKTFKNFKVELAPFQVIVGANGSGKSNLFDALQLLGRLAEMDLRSAFQDLRGEPDEIFTNSSAENPINKMRIAVEMFVNPTVRDNLGREEKLRTRRLRYEVEIVRGVDEYNFDKLEIVFQSLTSIPSAQDIWIQAYIPSLAENNGSISSNYAEEFISTGDTSSEKRDYHTVLHPDGRGLGFSLPGHLTSTALQGVTSTEYPHVFAAREELRSLQFFHFNPVVLRQPSPTKALQVLTSDGRNLAATLARIQVEDKHALLHISRDMANLVPGIVEIQVKRDKIGDRYVISAKTADGRVFSSHVLSDGTLRLLALATLKNDAQFHGILCLEEPENGISPLHIKNMARLLRKIATNLNDSSQLNEPLCQVLVTTHSPLFISQPDVIDTLLLALMPTRVQGKEGPQRVTKMERVVTPGVLSHFSAGKNEDKATKIYTIDMVKEYLHNELLDEADLQLEDARNKISEG